MWMLHVVVVGSWLCSPPPVGSVSRLARAGGTEHDRTPGSKHEGHTGTSDSNSSVLSLCPWKFSTSLAAFLVYPTVS